ncbi:hypothetical protein BH762_gp038 [Gordonia phage OneUp]|uniref:Uncharacterized protein n=1 Tax=Gordonia phage OneUp TaxID=1838074 RepID=A0A160DEW2_9CAUD|nr:hypothetical protein BH762_gp038 [Gordonia phage OneUp]ANA86480.1 hypothetical protein PBI_ONEUP_147 [Gordonia phage OneUp]
MELNLYRVIYLGGGYRDVSAPNPGAAVDIAQDLDAIHLTIDQVVSSERPRIAAVIDHYITTDAGIGDAHEEVVRFISADDSYYTV